MIKTSEDRYEGVIVDLNTLPQVKEDFQKEIVQLLESLDQKKLLWVEIPIEKSEFIPVLTNLGFEFHHCDERSLMLVIKLVPDAMIPTSRNYIAGVGAIVMDGNKLLVVKDRWFPGYKLPGGHIDKDETIKGALKREVYEETGVSIELESIMNIGHFRNGQFGESNIYMVCTAKALTKEITINDSSEIIDAQWMGVQDFLNADDTNLYNKSVVKAAISNTGLKLTEHMIKLRVKGGEVFY